MSEKGGKININRHAKLQYRDDGAEGKEAYWCFPIAKLYSGEISGRNIERQFSPASFSKSVFNDGDMAILLKSKFYIAVKELIIEWQDYQRETAGYIYCRSCDDQIAECSWLHHLIENEDDTKILLRFVKAPGLKTTILKIDKGDLEFIPISIEKCEVLNSIQQKRQRAKYSEIRREHRFECEIRSLFDKNETLPIKHAHITVEIMLK